MALPSLLLDIVIAQKLVTGDVIEKLISRDGTGVEERIDLTSSIVLALLRNSLEKSRRDSLRNRQLQHMLKGKKQIRAM